MREEESQRQQKGLGSRATARRRRYELRTVLAMQELYCCAQHEGQERWLWQGKHYRLCPDCQSQARRLALQTQHCREMGRKSFCHHCPRPCHGPKPETAAMMRYSGPRLLLRHPLLGLAHIYYILRAKLARGSAGPGGIE